MLPDSRGGAAVGYEAADGDGRSADLLGSWWPAVLSLVLAVSANVLAVSGLSIRLIGPAIGFWFIAVYPAYLLFASDAWPRSSAIERVAYSVMAVILLLIVGGLLLNTLLPLVGVQRPLEPVPIVILCDVLVASLYLLRWRYPRRVYWRASFKSLRWQESRLLVAAVLSVVLAVLGANHLNNGAGDQVSLMALVCLALTLLLLLRWHQRIRDELIGATLFLMSVALLFMTSLRGWYVTGHDIQTEYHAFRLTEAYGRWSMSNFHDAYNACLSITILPTEIVRLTDVAGPYVYKVFFQIIFALSTVIVYALSRRYWSPFISILAAVYFAGFPTFINDMPFENRQEVGMLFAGVAILAITNTRWRRRERLIVMFGAAIGLDLSHYSTMYIFVATVLLGWLASLVLRIIRLRWPASPQRRRNTVPATKLNLLSIGPVMALAAIIVLWQGVITQTAGPVLADAQATFSALLHTGGVRSGSVQYDLFGGQTADPATILANYRKQALANSKRHPGLYVPASIIARYPTPLVAPAVLPPTSIGRTLSRIGISAATLNTVIRQGAAKGEQLFVLVGLIALLAMPRLRKRVGFEFYSLGVGAVVVLAVLTVLPNLSVDYGVLRAFQAALILVGSTLVVGSFTIFSAFGEIWRLRIAGAVAVAIFLSTTGLIPQILGGYPAQLNLNNSGQYYDIYYTHPQDIAAVNWLTGKPGVLPNGVQAPYSSYRFYFTSLRYVTGTQDLFDSFKGTDGDQYTGFIFPASIQRSSWVLVGSTVIRERQATLTQNGDLITYRYPLRFLEDNKNLVYDNGGDEIFR
jgi:uncharacterized membrane protein